MTAIRAEAVASRLLDRLMRTKPAIAWAGPISRFEIDDAIALTFDDGPHPIHTPELLDLLARLNVRATFFMVGKFAAAYPGLVGEVARGGHAIGNHSFDHRSFPFLSWADRLDEIGRCERALGSLGPKLFRPPYGHIDGLTLLAAKRLGYRTLGWSVHAQDWAERPSHWMLDQLRKRTRGGSIVLLHDRLYTAQKETYFDRRRMQLMLTRFVEEFAPKYRFLTLPEMMAEAKPLRVPWYRLLSSDELQARKRHLAGLVEEEI